MGNIMMCPGSSPRLGMTGVQVFRQGWRGSMRWRVRQAAAILLLIPTTRTFVCRALSTVVPSNTEMLSDLCDATQIVGDGARVWPGCGAVWEFEFYHRQIIRPTSIEWALSMHEHFSTYCACLSSLGVLISLRDGNLFLFIFVNLVPKRVLGRKQPCKELSFFHAFPILALLTAMPFY